ncbi:MAG: hypothetical protein MJ245_06465 [Clostridia bacterium]|nr:hypothetical protein [Clostridia bacterium]
MKKNLIKILLVLTLTLILSGCTKENITDLYEVSYDEKRNKELKKVLLDKEWLSENIYCDAMEELVIKDNLTYRFNVCTDSITGDKILVISADAESTYRQIYYVYYDQIMNEVKVKNATPCINQNYVFGMITENSFLECCRNNDIGVYSIDVYEFKNLELESLNHIEEFTNDTYTALNNKIDEIGGQYMSYELNEDNLNDLLYESEF